MSAAAGPPGPGTGVPVRDVVRDVVAEVAAEELPVVEGLAALDHEAVARHLAARPRRRREPLGFGWGNAVPMVTPVVWQVVDEVAAAATGTGVRRSRGLWRGNPKRGHPRRGTSRRAGEAAVPALSGDRLDEARRLLLEVAGHRGLDAARAAELADAVVRRLDAVRHHREPGDAAPAGL